MRETGGCGAGEGGGEGTGTGTAWLRNTEGGELIHSGQGEHFLQES